MTDIKPGKKFFSVVYEITDPDTFQSAASQIPKHMAEGIVEHGCKVAACGWGDYATERDAYDQRLRELGEDPDEAVSDFIAIELAEVGSFPEGQDFKDAVRDITG